MVHFSIQYGMVRNGMVWYGIMVYLQTNESAEHTSKYHNKNIRKYEITV